MQNQKATSRAKLSDQALTTRTGKSYDEWFIILDRAGAMNMSHKEIAQYLCDHYGEDKGWHFQMLTVVYERERKNRQKYEKCDGLYEISVSKTIAVPIQHAYEAWNNAKVRNCWLVEPVEMGSSTLNKTIRFIWPNDATTLIIAFYEKGSTKCQVVVQHQKLSNSVYSEKMKQFWKVKLEDLKKFLEGEGKHE